MPLLLVRADGGPGIGNGHVVRCIALAQAWSSSGGRAALLSAHLPDDLRRLARHAGVDVEPLESPTSIDELASTVARLGAHTVAFDGYRFDAAYQGGARPARVAVIDDHATIGSYAADLIVDQNLDADSTVYAQEGTEVLAGAAYVLLRRDFILSDSVRPIGDRVERVIVTLGGSPGRDVVDAVSRAIEAAGLTPRATYLTAGAPVDDMAALLATADLAVAAAGSGAWELCALGVPMVLLVLAPNQAPVAGALERRGAARVVDYADAGALTAAVKNLASDQDERRRLSVAASAVVDGRGAARVAIALKRHLLTLRDAGDADARLLYEWANDGAVRAQSFNDAPIAWDDHVRWFASRLADADTMIRIAAFDGELVGQIRFERDRERAPKMATVGVSLAQDARGQGWASALIDAGTRSVLDDGWATEVHALIKLDNVASQRAFASAGYVLDDTGTATVRGARAVRYIRRSRP